MMAAAVSGWLLNTVRSTYRHATLSDMHPSIFLQTREYAARKGTREKARKLKAKEKAMKAGQASAKQNLPRKGKTQNLSMIRIADMHKPLPVDNVWLGRRCRWRVYPFEEAVQCHRETHHPTMLNMPREKLHMFVELNMQGEKKTKLVNSFTRIAATPHAFDIGEDRKILFFSNNPESLNIAENAGATAIGDREVVKMIQAGEFSIKEYDHILSDPDILPDLLLIRGLLKKKFPNKTQGTLGVNVEALVKQFKYGVKYFATQHSVLTDYGTINAAFGTLDMDTNKLEANFRAIINDINSVRPRREGDFITRIRLICAGSPESLKVDIDKYLAPEEEEEYSVEDAIVASN